MSEYKSLEDIWVGDLLGRKAEAGFLETFLKNSVAASTQTHDRRSLVVNVKARWGAGKTFFLNRFAEQLRLSGHKVAQLDSWRADPGIDPLVSLVAAIRKEILPQLKGSGAISKAWGVATQTGGTLLLHTLKGVGAKIGKKIVGEQFDSMGEIITDALADSSSVSSDDISIAKDIIKESFLDATDKVELNLAVSSYFLSEVEKVGKQQDAVKKFTASVEKIASEFAKRKDGAAPFYVIVDELDRCRPTFAIELLERINHLFDTDGVVFIIGTDSDELEHSIRAVYGSGFDSHSYLHRFFSYTYNMAEPDTDAWIEHLIHRYGIDLEMYIVPPGTEKLVLLKSIGSAVGLSTRDYLHIFFLVQTVERNWKHQAKIDLVLLYALAIVIFTKSEKYLTELHLRTEEHTTEICSALNSIKFEVSGRGGRSNRSIHRYIADTMKYAKMTIHDALDANQKDGGDSLNRHWASMLHIQIAHRDSAHYSAEPPLWSRYADLLRTAARVTLPEDGLE